MQAIERAALALLQAVQQAQNPASINSTLSLAPAPTLSQAIAALLQSKSLAGRRTSSLKKLGDHLARFARGRKGRHLADVSADEIEVWLHGQGWSARSMRGLLIDVRTLFAFAERRAWVPRNPALAVEMPVVEWQPPAIHTPDEVRLILDTARRRDLAACVHLAIRYFAGLRRSEALALSPEEIRPGRIEVTAAKSKTRARRLVTIQPNLAAWLALGGAIPLRDANTRLDAVVKASGVAWRQNAPRHSFCSYHLAAFGNAGQTALEAGHSEAMLFAHYREIVAPADAAAYWRIAPL